MEVRRRDLTDHLIVATVAEIRPIPIETLAILPIEEERLFQRLRQANAFFKYRVQPSGSGSRWANPEEGRYSSGFLGLEREIRLKSKEHTHRSKKSIKHHRQSVP